MYISVLADPALRPDAYQTLTRRRSAVERSGGVNPQWNQTLEFPGLSSEVALHFSLWTKHTLGSSSFLGQTPIIPVKNCILQQYFTLSPSATFPLGPRPGSKTVPTGSLTFSVSFYNAEHAEGLAPVQVDAELQRPGFYSRPPPLSPNEVGPQSAHPALPPLPSPAAYEQAAPRALPQQPYPELGRLAAADSKRPYFDREGGPPSPAFGAVRVPPAFQPGGEFVHPPPPYGAGEQDEQHSLLRVALNHPPLPPSAFQRPPAAQPDRDCVPRPLTFVSYSTDGSPSAPPM